MMGPGGTKRLSEKMNNMSLDGMRSCPGDVATRGGLAVFDCFGAFETGAMF